uniref:Putative WD40 repeat-like protein n=1 Tax=Moniliophthora roreri TaxID=221103 RepID=A0A0W0FFP9_MONRR
MPSSRPQLILQPSVNTTTVVTTTTTTTTYAPITLPPLPAPSSPKNPKNYPLLHASLPASLRNIPLTFPGGARATLRDATDDEQDNGYAMQEEQELASGKGWRMLRRDEDSETAKVIGLAEALERYGKKREHDDVDEDLYDEDRMQGVEATVVGDDQSMAPPRKKARGSPSSPTTSTTTQQAAPISPLPSPHGSPPPPDNLWSVPLPTPHQPQQPMQLNIPQTHTQTQTVSSSPPFQPDLSLTTLLTLPTLLNHFVSLPVPVQSHFLLTLLRHSPLPVLRTLHSVLEPTLARDFLTLLPPELRGKIWYGGESETAFERFLLKRRKRIGFIAAPPAAHALSQAETTAREAYPSPRNSTVVLPGTGHARHVPTPITPTHSHQHNPSKGNAVPVLPLQAPHPYKILYKSRHLTRTKWMNNPNPRHISFPAHGHSVVTCLIFASVPNPNLLPNSPAAGRKESDVTGGTTRIISASDDHCIHVYDPRSGKLEMRLEGHEGGVWALAASGGLLVSGSTDRTVRIWDLTGTVDPDERDVDLEEAEVEEAVDAGRRKRGKSSKGKDKGRGSGAASTSVAGSSGSSGASGSKSTSLKGRCMHVFGGHTSTVRCLAIVKPEWVDVEYPIEDCTKTNPTVPKTIRREKWPKRPLIVTGSRDHSLRVWTLPRKGEEEYKCYSPGGRGADGESMGENDVCDADENPYHLLHLEGHEHAVRALAARGRTLVSGSYDCTVRVWDIVNGVCRWVLIGHTQKVYSVVLDPARNQTMSGSMDGTVRIWSTSLGTCLHVLTGHTSLVGLLGLSPTHLVSAAADSTLRIWDPDNGELKHVLAAHTGAITCFQHDEFKVVSGSDGTLKVWDLRGWEEGGGGSNQTIGGGANAAGNIPGVGVAPVPVANNAPLGFGPGGGVGAAVGGGIPGVPAAAMPPVPGAPNNNGTGGMAVRDLLTGITNVWQVAFEGRWCVAASNRNDQTVLDIWDFGRQDGDVDISNAPFGPSGEDGNGVDREDEGGGGGSGGGVGGDEYGDEDGTYEEGWIGEPPGGMYDEGEDSNVEESGDEDDERGRLRYPEEDNTDNDARDVEYAMMEQDDQRYLGVPVDEDAEMFGRSLSPRSYTSAGNDSDLDSGLGVGTSSKARQKAPNRVVSGGSSNGKRPITAKHRRQQSQMNVVDEDEEMVIAATASVTSTQDYASSQRGMSTSTAIHVESDSEGQQPPGKRSTRGSTRRNTTEEASGGSSRTKEGSSRRRPKWL